MTHSTSARKEAMGLKQRASCLSRESKALEGIEGTAPLAGERQAEVARLRKQARELQEKAMRMKAAMPGLCIAYECCSSGFLG